MKIYPQEIAGLKFYFDKNHPNFAELKFTADQERRLKQELQNWKQFEKQHSLLHLAMTLLPLFILFFGFYGCLFPFLNYLKEADMAKAWAALCLGLVLGYLEYSFVIYVLHEGGGHGVFLKGLQGFPLLKKVLNQSARLFFADPLFYGLNHPSHHRFLGTPKDLTNTQFVLPRRFLKAIIPGAGILFPNDFQVYQNPERTRSRTLSEMVGGLTLLVLNLIVSPALGWGWSILATLIVAPWFAFLIDRTRECSEHNLLPADNHLGSRELGLTPLALFIGGGPWGQPCHVAHHLAPNLNWYQQIHLHFQLKKILSPKQKRFLGFEGSPVIPLQFVQLLFKNWQTLRALRGQILKEKTL